MLAIKQFKSDMMNIWRRLLYVAACSLCIGCANTRTIPPDFSGKKQSMSSVALVPSDIGEKISTANCRYDSLQTSYTLQTTGNTSDNRSFSCEGSLAVMINGRLRMYGKTMLAGKVFDILVKDGIFFVYLPKQGKLIRGSTNVPYYGTVRNGIAMSPQAVLKSVLHQSIDFFSNSFFEVEPHFFIANLVQSRNGINYLEQKLWINNATYIIEKKQVFDQNGMLVFDVKYSNFYDVGNQGVFPREMNIVNKITDETFQLRFSNIKINTTLPDTVFELDTPKNIDILTTD